MHSRFRESRGENLDRGRDQSRDQSALATRRASPRLAANELRSAFRCLNQARVLRLRVPFLNTWPRRVYTHFRLTFPRLTTPFRYMRRAGTPLRSH